MREVLDVLLPRIIPQGIEFDLVPHEGRRDLELSIPRKLRALGRDWETGEMTRFVIVRDNDRANCKKLKAKLIQVCQNEERPDCLIRLVCQSLESWYLGDLTAVEKACDARKLSARVNEEKFRHPDKLGNPEEELKKLLPRYKKIKHAKLIAPRLDIDNNASTSFRIFVSGVRRLVRAPKLPNVH